MTPIISAEKFVALLKCEFEEEIAPGEFREDALIVADLGLDSLQLIRLAALVESLGPVTIPEQFDMVDVRIGDLYHYYKVSVENAPAR